MTFEAKKFRPREVVKHVVQMASTSVAADNKTLHVEAHVSPDVPLEVGLVLYFFISSEGVPRCYKLGLLKPSFLSLS
jgi:hypothetical protein